MAHLYLNPTVTTGFSVTAPNDTGVLVIQAAATLATGTIVMPAAPTHEQTLSLSSTQIVTTLTLTPGTGQTIVGAITALSANAASARWIFNSPNLTWYPY